MIDWPIGLSTGCFYQRNILDCLEAIRQAGFCTLEICSSPTHLDYHDMQQLRATRKCLQELCLEAYSFHAPWADSIDITSPDPALREQAMAEIRQAVAAASLLGVRYFVLHPGPEKSNLPSSETLPRMENAAAALSEVAECCERAGLALVLENKLPHLFSGHVRDLMWLLGSIRSPRVGVCLDTGHAFLSRELSVVVQKLSGHLWMVHASDNLGQFDDHLPPGEGVLEWGRLLRELAQARFGGTLVLEIAPRESLEATLQGSMQARLFLRHLLRTVTP